MNLQVSERQKSEERKPRF